MQTPLSPILFPSVYDQGRIDPHMILRPHPLSASCSSARIAWEIGGKMRMTSDLLEHHVKIEVVF